MIVPFFSNPELFIIKCDLLNCFFLSYKLMKKIIKNRFLIKCLFMYCIVLDAPSDARAARVKYYILPPVMMWHISHNLGIFNTSMDNYTVTQFVNHQHRSYIMYIVVQTQCSAQAAISRQLRTQRSNVSFFSRVVRQMSPPISCPCWTLGVNYAIRGQMSPFFPR